jgi:hypothetical protein
MVRILLYTACEEGWLSFYGATAVEPNSTWNKAEVSKIAYLAYGITGDPFSGSATYTEMSLRVIGTIAISKPWP